MGTWIEILGWIVKGNIGDVVPYVGTWIEMTKTTKSPKQSKKVVPYVGTWIEIQHSRRW